MRVGSLEAMLRQELMRTGLFMPSGRFFTPTEIFWGWMLKQPKRVYLDCGAGNGHLVDEAVALGIAMLGMDMGYRPDQSATVMLGDCTQFPFSPKLWPLICRPSHDGFCMETVENALALGAKAVYVGLPDNVGRDLDEDFLRFAETCEGVGQEGEVLLVLEKR